MKNVILGLFEDQAHVGRAIHKISQQRSARNLMVITSDRIIRKPKNIDVDQLSTQGNRSLDSIAVTAKGESARWDRSGLGSYFPTKTLEKIGLVGIREILESKGVAADEAHLLAEGVRQGGILLLAEFEGAKHSDVEEALGFANRVIVKYV